jgi:hypothetical protein
MASANTQEITGSNLISALARFALSASEASQVFSTFDLAAAECRFIKEDDILGTLERFKGVSGIYFWLLRVGDQRFKIYLGQTTSLSYRLTNYLSDFQPHAPNDFKLRLFHEFVIERLSDACFELYFDALSKPDAVLSELRCALTNAENSALKRFTPILLNGRGRPSAAAKESLQHAFRDYYRSGFESLLAGKDTSYP